MLFCGPSNVFCQTFPDISQLECLVEYPLSCWNLVGTKWIPHLRTSALWLLAVTSGVTLASLYNSQHCHYYQVSKIRVENRGDTFLWNTGNHL
jgi:hypothetical protein